GALSEGVIWQLNRAIEITGSSPIQFNSVNASSVSVIEETTGLAAIGEWSQGLDPITGEVDSTRIRFQPACPLMDGDTAGLQPGGVRYLLRIGGADGVGPSLRALDGTPLEATVEIGFVTPIGTNPATLFHDARPGPPGLVFRGQLGVSTSSLEATRFQIGGDQPVNVQMQLDSFGIVQVAPNSMVHVPTGLPLNHRVAPDNHVALVAEFDQPLFLGESNLARIGLDYFDGTWHPLPARIEALQGCGRRGSTVRIQPEGTLPPGRELRVRLDSGLSDLTGQADAAPRFVYLPLRGTDQLSPIGGRMDAIVESFRIGGDAPGSMEDITSDLDAERGFWGQGFIAGVETPGGMSRVRSKWYAVGLAGMDGAGPPVVPAFSFVGTDARGVVRADGGAVVLDPPVLGPLQPFEMQPYSVDLALGDLLNPEGLYASQPGLLAGDRIQISSSTQAVDTQIFGTRVELDGGTVELGLGIGCYAPGFQLDCAAWDLAALFPEVNATTVEIVPRSFEVYTWVHRDSIHPDHRVTVLFDAAEAGADGRVDESTAHSLSNGWSPSVEAFSSGAPGGAPYAYLRFEVLFELDVSGDGYHPLERSPVLDFIKVPIDFRR
ncbi:MAG: hypothetical protein AAGG01_16100, partial [Planctomycetota bacterium]